VTPKNWGGELLASIPKDPAAKEAVHRMLGAKTCGPPKELGMEEGTNKWEKQPANQWLNFKLASGSRSDNNLHLHLAAHKTLGAEDGFGVPAEL
jgi:hypothetical protein